MKIVSVILLSVFLAAAQDSPRPDQWHGLTLDVSTTTEATAALGPASSEKPDKITVRYIGKWFDKQVQSKAVLSRMEFKSVDGFKSVDLYFKEGKLVAIDLSLKEAINPTALKNIYGVEFVPYVSGFDESFAPEDFERHEGKVYPKNYPSLYSLVAVATRSIITSTVRNDSFGAIMKDSFKIRDGAGGGFPGKVTDVMLLSRKMEDHKGADLLK